MFSILLIVCLSILSFVVLFSIGYYLGVHYRLIYDQLQSIDKDINRWKHQEEEMENESAIIETTPQLVREKVRKGEETSDESAIITTKSPQEVRQAKDTKLQQDLDRLSQ